MVCKHYAEGKSVKEDQRGEKNLFLIKRQTNFEMRLRCHFTILKEGKQLVRGREGNFMGDQLSLKKRDQPSCSEVFSI